MKPQEAIGVQGRYYEITKQGNLFRATVGVAGIALITTATTGNHPTLWNPAGNKFNLSIERLNLTYISGTNAPTGLGWYKTSKPGSSKATGGVIATWTNVDPINCLVDEGRPSSMLWAPAINTFATAPAFLLPAGIALATMAAASTPAPFTVFVDYNGSLVIPPNVALSLCSTAATTTALFVVEILFQEKER